MNPETSQFLENNEIQALHERLSISISINKPNFDTAKLAALGLIFVRFQRLEHSIRGFIGMLANLAGNQPLVNILTVKNSFKNLLIILSALAKDKDIPQKEDLDLVIRHCIQAEQIRNQLIHSVWTSGPRFKTNISIKKGLEHKFEDYTTEDLNCIASEIDKLDSAVEALELIYIKHQHAHGETPSGVAFLGDA